MELRSAAPAVGLASQPGSTHPAAITCSLGAFLGALDRAFGLLDAQRAAVRNDFARGIDALSAQGTPLSAILHRLDPARLDGFYARPRQGFYPLDDGAKQYPISMVRGQMAMFRLAASLDAPVEPALLQLALLFTLRRFPHYAAGLRRGAFWYYLRPLPARFSVQPDTDTICAPIDVSDETQPLFRVLYRGSCVSVELFHALTDGMGGMIFLKTLLTEYYRLQGEHSVEADPQALDTAAPSLPADVENGFVRFRSRQKGEPLLASPAVQIPAEPYKAGECRVDSYEISASQLTEAARARGVTVTALMGAVILSAVRQTVRATEGRYQLQVTVDLRRMFESATLRNFSWYGALRLDAKEELSQENLAQAMHTQIKAFTGRETLERNISSAQRAIRLLGYVPLPWKAMVLRTAYRMAGDYFFTTTLSNLGRIDLQGPLKYHVRHMAAILGPSPSNPYGFALATVHDRAVLSVTRTTGDLALLENLMDSARTVGLTLTRKG
ncbi:MAG: hypothetical protein IH607_07050 [Firmicutes bacterium]|nr:hypothetical protein [Bacillota bacterium]